MARFRSRILVLALALASGFSAHAAPPIQQQMSPEEFRAAGLEKLNADELARLNVWLGRTIDSETAKAATEAKRKLVDENRGFFNFGSTEPVRSTLVGDFRGFAKGKTYTLANGQVWKQMDEAVLVGARLTNPKVVVNPSIAGNIWYMSVGSYGTRAKVVRVK